MSIKGGENKGPLKVYEPILSFVSKPKGRGGGGLLNLNWVKLNLPRNHDFKNHGNRIIIL